MIRRIGLKNWRAYDSALIPFEPGTTFVVAPNGIGKTSLLEAADFALTGNSGALTSPVQLGAEYAEVEVALQLPDSRVLVIRRTLFADPAKDGLVEATVGDSVLGPEDIRREVTEAFDASPAFIARNALLRETLRDGTGLDPREQLSRAFGLANHSSKATELDGRAAELQDEATQLTRALRKGTKDVSRLESEIEEAERELDVQEQHLAERRRALEVVASRRDAYTTQVSALRQVAAWEKASAEVVELARLHLPDVTIDRLRDEVEQLSIETDTRIREERESSAKLEAQIELTGAAMADLTHADTDCPVCLRPLDDRDRSTAEDRHRAALTALESALAAIDLEAAESMLVDVRQLVRRCDALGDRPEAPAGGELLEDPHEQFDAERNELEHAVATHRSVQSNLAELRDELEVARDLEDVRQQSVLAWRRWALTSATAATVSNSVEDVLAVEMEPIVEALDNRWRRLFPDRPDLRFDLAGNPWRPVRGHRLEIDAFSAGERVAARLLLQLAILSTATDVNFCWIDEPLEHLDPQARRLVAGMLSHGRSALGLRQLVVTTYEEELAQRLADADDATHIEYVRAGTAA